MKKYVNGEYLEMTPEEITAATNRERLARIEESRRPLTAEEVSALLITRQINALAVDNNTALRMLSFYPEWAADAEYPEGHKVQRGGRLWRVVQAHTAQTGWEPENAASLWEQVNETYAGTLEDPVPYDGNMVLESGKYYYQNHGIYLCVRDTGNPVFHDLRELVGIYVEVVC